MNSPLSIALSYIQRGWNPVPVPFRSKGPVDRGWQGRIIDEASAPRFFNGNQQNIGVILGPTSNGLTDVDLDCAEASKLAPYLLPQTNAIFGRTSAPQSHWLYRTELGGTSERAVIAFRDPTIRGGKATLVELRVGGRSSAQTVFPGSVHESGEPIEWSKTGNPAAVDGHHLKRRVAALAAAALILRNWPPRGAKRRHSAARVIGGFLGRCGWSAKEAETFVGAVAQAVGDDDVKDRMRAAADAVEAYQNGKHAHGLPDVAHTFGEHVARSMADWLGYKRTGTEEDREVVDDKMPASNIRAQCFVYRDPRTIPPRKWLYDKHFIRGYVSADIAPGGIGKTSLVLVEAIAMASGRNLGSVVT